MKRLRTLIGTVALALASGAVTIALVAIKNDKPTDHNIASRFHRERAAFVKLREMIRAEPTLDRIGDDNVGDYWLYQNGWHHSDGGPTLSRAQMLAAVGLNAARYDEYLLLLRRVQGYRVTRATFGVSDVAVHVHRAGTVVAGYTKDVIFCPTAAPAPVVSDTDVFPEAPCNGTRYHNLSDGWYIETTRD